MRTQSGPCQQWSTRPGWRRLDEWPASTIYGWLCVFSCSAVGDTVAPRNGHASSSARRRRRAGRGAVDDAPPGGRRRERSSSRLRAVAFGQQVGPPASAGQLQELLALLKEAGHESFREARGPMGFSQRQGGGKFTRDEATEYIDRLQAVESGEESAVVVPASRLATEQLVRRMPDEQLVAELKRRGWTVVKS